MGVNGVSQARYPPSRHPLSARTPSTTTPLGRLLGQESIRELALRLFPPRAPPGWPVPGLGLIAGCSRTRIRSHTTFLTSSMPAWALGCMAGGDRPGGPLGQHHIRGSGGREVRRPAPGHHHRHRLCRAHADDPRPATLHPRPCTGSGRSPPLAALARTLGPPAPSPHGA